MKGGLRSSFDPGEADLGLRRSHWFHTVVMTRADIERLFPNQAMRKRCASNRRPAMFS